MNQDQMYEQKWEFRRKEGDLETSSEEKQSSSSRGRALHKSIPFEEEEASHKNEQNPPKEAAKRERKSAKNTQNKRPKTSNKNRGPRTGKNKKENTKISNKSSINSSLHGLETHVNVLVKELSSSREGFMKWMEDEMEKLVAGNANSKPSNMTNRMRKIEPCKKSSMETIPNWASTRVETAKTNAIQTPTVSALPDNSSKPKLGHSYSGMVLSSANTNRPIAASSYLNMPNLSPRPLAENYLVKANPSALGIQPVVLNSQQQQLGSSYYQGINLQSDRIMSGSMGSYGAYIPLNSASHMGLKGGYNAHSLGLSGSDAFADDNNFPSLRRMRFCGGSDGV